MIDAFNELIHLVRDRVQNIEPNMAPVLPDLVRFLGLIMVLVLSGNYSLFKDTNLD